MPPLRERKEDIPLLAEQFRHRAGRRHGIQTLPLSTGCLNAMQNYSWPGNVRELENAVERAVILSAPGGTIRIEHLGFIPEKKEEEPSRAASDTGEGDSLVAMEKKHIFAVLEKCKGNRTHAAVRLGISIRTLRNKLRDYKADGTEAPLKD